MFVRERAGFGLAGQHVGCGFNISFNTEWVIFGMLFPSNLLANTEKIKTKAGRNNHKQQNKPRLTQN